MVRVSRVALSRARRQYEQLRLTEDGRRAAATQPELGFGAAELEEVSQASEHCEFERS